VVADGNCTAAAAAVVEAVEAVVAPGEGAASEKNRKCVAKCPVCAKR
jgi:hypothetical protein